MRCHAHCTYLWAAAAKEFRHLVDVEVLPDERALRDVPRPARPLRSTKPTAHGTQHTEHNQTMCQVHLTERAWGRCAVRRTGGQAVGAASCT